MSGWLDGLRALDLTDERGLLAGQMLAKLGMDVIQVEPPAGSSARRTAPLADDGRSFYWSAYAAGKRGITLDLDQPEGRDLLLRLVERADFLFESARPGRMAALGLSYEALRARNPKLIHVSITPFGSTGPKRDYADAELVLWAAGGPLHQNRDLEGPPLRISVPQAYLHGAADAAAGALVAHFAQLQTGRGQHVDISVQQSVTQATLASHLADAVGHADFSFLPKPSPKDGAASVDLSGSGARTRRSKWVVRDGLIEMHLGMGPAAGDKANNLFAWMREEGALPDGLESWDWVALPKRIRAGEVGHDAVEQARTAVAEFLAHYTKAELQAEALTRKLLLAPVNDVGDLLASEQLKARDFFVTVNEGGAPRTLPGPFAFGAPGMFAEPAPAPTLGEHNAAVFGDLLGLDAAARAALHERSVLMSIRPLGDLKVLDLAWVVAGPAIGRALADYGATVVRVESSLRVETARLMGPYPGGQPDPERCALYDTYNSGKLGLALDLREEAARDVVRDLARWADVLVESFAPGQMARWGLAPETLRAANPRLIGVSTSLMGQTGPLKAFAGFGNMGAAVAGFQAIVGREGATPVGPFGPYTDFVGPRFGLVALLAALEHRRRTGEGCWLDVSQAEAGIQFLAPAVAQGAAGGGFPTAAGNRDPQFAPHGVFPCAGDDDAWVAIAVRDDAEWAKLADLIGGEALDAAFATLAGRKAQEDRVEALVEAWTRGRSAETVEHSLQALGVPAHKAAASADVVADPQLAARGAILRLAHPLGGESVVDASRYQLSETPAAYARPAPHFGRDAAEVLQTILGYDADRIAELERAGVLR